MCARGSRLSGSGRDESANQRSVTRLEVEELKAISKAWSLRRDGSRSLVVVGDKVHRACPDLDLPRAAGKQEGKHDLAALDVWGRGRDVDPSLAEVRARVEVESSSPELFPCRPPAPFARLLFTLDDVFFIFALSVGLYLRDVPSEDTRQ